MWVFKTILPLQNTHIFKYLYSRYLQMGRTDVLAYSLDHGEDSQGIIINVHCVWSWWEQVAKSWDTAAGWGSLCLCCCPFTRTPAHTHLHTALLCVCHSVWPRSAASVRLAVAPRTLLLAESSQRQWGTRGGSVSVTLPIHVMLLAWEDQWEICSPVVWALMI